MTMLPEPREARVYARRRSPAGPAGEVAAAEEAWAGRESAPVEWDDIGLTQILEPATEVFEPLREAVAPIVMHFNVHMNLFAEASDVLFIHLAAGTKDRKLRLLRKRARRRVKARAKAARIAAQPSYQGKKR